MSLKVTGKLFTCGSEVERQIGGCVRKDACGNSRLSIDTSLIPGGSLTEAVFPHARAWFTLS